MLLRGPGDFRGPAGFLFEIIGGNADDTKTPIVKLGP
jgi:hypothetical protein